MKNSIKRSLRASRTHGVMLAMTLSMGSTALAEDSGFNRIVAFGDSLMDSGNAFVLSGEIATPPFEPVPSAPYAIGGHHFSNGQTWVEGLGQSLGLQMSTGPSARNPGQFTNFAVGGSRAREDARGVSATQQVMQHLSNGPAAADTLYLFGFGSNDVRDALQAGPVNGPVILGEAVGAIASNLNVLCASGARHIVVANVANIGTTPFAQALGQPVVDAATFVSGSFNTSVQNAISAFVKPSCPGTQFYTLDMFSLSTSIFAYPSGFGFSDAQSCLKFGVTGGAICANPNARFFWDAIHPTKAGHAIVAAEAAKLFLTP